MPGLLQRFLGSAILLRRLVSELAGIRAQLTRQGDLIESWMQAAGVVIPAKLQTAAPEDLRETGASFLDPIEQALAEDYVARTQTDTGRAPSEEEILSYLADEKTVSMHARLKERANLLDLQRLGSRS
jgi:hypothetical protein